MKKWMIALSIVLVFVFGLTSLVSAQEEEPPIMPDEHPHGLRARLAAWRYPGVFKHYSQAIADALGLTLEEMKERVKNGETPLQIAQSLGMNEEAYTALLVDVREGLLAQAVEDGKISKEQAEEIRQRWEEGGTRSVLLRELGSQARERLAEELGLSLEAMKERLVSGETLLEIAQSQGLSEEAFQALAVDVQDQVIDQAVEEGFLSEDQAEKLKVAIEEKGGFFQWVRKRMQGMPGKRFLYPRLAEQLGLDWDIVKHRLVEGETWPEIMDDLGIEREDLHGAMDELGADIMQKARESGLISPDRAETLQEGGVLRPFRWLRQRFQSALRFRGKLLKP